MSERKPSYMLEVQVFGGGSGRLRRPGSRIVLRMLACVSSLHVGGNSSPLVSDDQGSPGVFGLEGGLVRTSFCWPPLAQRCEAIDVFRSLRRKIISKRINTIVTTTIVGIIILSITLFPSTLIIITIIPVIITIIIIVVMITSVSVVITTVVIVMSVTAS